MTRYVAVAPGQRPRGWQSETEYGWQERPSCVVLEQDSTPESTGLYDAEGRELYRVRDRVKMGFQARH